jgi:predicted transcriptional regulator of viral defense system
LFEGHEENRRKFLTYVINNHYFSLLYKRLKTLNGIAKVKEFAEKNGLKEKTARMYLIRNFRRGFIKRRVERGCYEISTMGKKFITLYESVLSELSTFHHT